MFTILNNQQYASIYLCDDILNVVLNFLPLINIYSTKLLNKYYKEFINTKFMLENYIHSKVNIMIIKKHNKFLKKIIVANYYNIYNYHLVGCDKLVVLDLNYAEHITDMGLKYISNIKNLKLGINNNITDEGLKYIPNIQNLNLSSNNLITNKGLKYISGISNLYIGRNSNITDEGLKFIPNILTLNLCLNLNITNEGLKIIPNARKLILCFNLNITDEGLRHIPNIEYLNLSFNTKITDEGLKHIPKASMGLCQKSKI